MPQRHFAGSTSPAARPSRESQSSLAGPGNDAYRHSCAAGVIRLRVFKRQRLNGEAEAARPAVWVTVHAFLDDAIGPDAKDDDGRAAHLAGVIGLRTVGVHRRTRHSVILPDTSARLSALRGGCETACVRLTMCLAALCLTLSACGDDSSTGATDCTDDAVEIDGVTYGRDPEQDCQFVDADGELLRPQP